MSSSGVRFAVYSGVSASLANGLGSLETVRVNTDRAIIVVHRSTGIDKQEPEGMPDRRARVTIVAAGKFFLLLKSES